MISELLFRVLCITSLLIFATGILMMILRREGIWITIGQIVSFKAAIFGTGVILNSFPDKIQIMSTIMFCGLFFYIAFFLVGVALLIRVRRFGGKANLSRLNELRH